MRRAVPFLLAVFTFAAPAGAQTLPQAEVTGFRSVLAQGQGATTTATDLALNLTTDATPKHFTSQLPLYRDLAVKWPGLEPRDLDTFFKPTDFGVTPGGVASTISPKAGVTIVRDERFGVPRVTGETRADVMWGAGYAQAQDRLFLMDVLRRTAKATTAGLIGADGAEADAAQLAQQDFTDAEYEAQFESLDERHGPDGLQMQNDLRAFVDGINARIAEVRADPSIAPAEYAALGTTPRDWTISDTAAQAVLLVSQFNVAGLGERENEVVLTALEGKLGKRGGRRVFDDLRRLDDLEAPTTADRTFRDDRPGKVRRGAVVRFDAGSVRPRKVLTSGGGEGGRALLPAGRLFPRTTSNAVLVSKRLSQSGKPLMSAGPQVGYYSPQIFMEIELHGGGIDVEGVSFPGAAPLVLIGHGKRFAWSGTSPMSDLADTFVNELCNVDGSAISDPEAATGHRYKGRCEPLKIRDQATTTPVAPTSPAAPQTVTLRAVRSVHGPVTHFATVGGKPVAISQRKTVDGRELDAFFAFERLNSNKVTDFASFRRAWADYPGGENWFYVSPTEVGWQLSGFMPVRARGVDMDLPTNGDGSFDWRGQLPFARMPWTGEPTRRGYIVSWNNKEAPGWRSPSDTWTLGPTHRSLLLERRLRAELKRAGGKIDLAGLVRTTEAAALGDLEGQELFGLLTRVIGAAPADVAPLIDLLGAWRSRGAEHRDFDVDGSYEDGAAVRLMRVWAKRLAEGIFQPVVGEEAMTLLDRGPLDLTPSRSEFGGWHGQLQKVLRRALRRKQTSRFSRTYCGSRRTCRAVALATLRDSADELRKATGGGPEAWTAPVETQSIVTAGAISTPTWPLQNRGTYHQVAEPSAQP